MAKHPGTYWERHERATSLVSPGCPLRHDRARATPSDQACRQSDDPHAGTRTALRRVHRAGRAADSFNPTPRPSKLTGGRVDRLDGSYAYTYLGGTDAGALAETICRDLPLGGAARVVPARFVQDRLITTVDITRDLPILALHGAHLTQVHAPLHLTKYDASQYEITREWAQRLREWLPVIAGLAYRACHNEDEMAWVLFEDRPPTSHPRAAKSLRDRDDPLPLDSGVGLHLVKQVLHAHNATPA